MLRVDLREIHRGPMDTPGVLKPDDPVFEGLELGLAGPVSVEGRLQETGPGEFFWRGKLRGEVRGGCRRCLAEVTQPVDVELNLLFSEDPDAADDPSVYPLAPAAPVIDLGLGGPVTAHRVHRDANHAQSSLVSTSFLPR